MATVVWYLAACAALAHLISSFECPEQRTQALIPDPEDCRKYYHCLPGNRVFPMQCPNGLVFDARQKVCIWDSTARSCAPDTKLEPIKPWQPSDSSNKASTPAPQRNKSYNRQKTAKAKNSRKQSQNQRRRNQPEANKRKPVTPRPVSQKRARNNWRNNARRRPATTTTTTTTTTTRRPTTSTTTTTTTTPPPTTATIVRTTQFGEGDVRGGLSRESTEGVNLIGNILATLGFDVPSHDNPADQGIPVNPDAMLRQESDRAEKVSPVHNSNDNSGDTSNDRKGLLFQDMNRQNARQQHARHRRSPEDNMILDDVRCPSGYAYFPDPSSCTAFYHCYNWQPMRKLCPPGLFFDDQTYVCNWPHNVNCIEGYRSKTLYSFNEMIKETRESKKKSKSLVVPKTFPTRTTTTRRPFRKPKTTTTTTTSTTTTTTTTAPTTEPITTTAPPTTEMPTTEMTTDDETTAAFYTTSLDEEGSTPVRGFRGWRTTDYDFTTPPSTADPDYDGFGTTSDSIFSSSDPQPSGKPVWSRRQQQSSTNEKERSDYPFYNFNPTHSDEKQESQAQNDVGEFETTAQPQGLDESNGNNGVEVIRGKFLSVKNPKDRNSGYSLRSYDDAKDTDSKPMRSPFDSPRKENPAHRRGLYGAPNTKNFDYFDVPKDRSGHSRGSTKAPERSFQNVPKERNIRPLGSNDWRTTDSSFSWMVTSSLPQGHDIVKPELYASNDIKKSNDKDAENKSTDAPATTTASTLRTSSTTAQPTKTTSEKQPATSKSTVSSSTSVLPNVTTTTSVPADEKKNTSISGDSATTVTTTGTTDSGKTNRTEETSTTSEPASFQTTSQAEEDSTQHSPSNQTRSSTDKTNFTASTSPLPSSTTMKLSTSPSVTTAAPASASTTSSTTSSTTTTAPTTTPVAFAAAKVPFYARRSQGIMDPTWQDTGRSRAASSTFRRGTQLRARPHETQGQSFVNPYHQPLMDSPASRPHETQGQSFVNPYHQPLMDSPASKPQGYRDFKNPEDVQIEKFMINLLNDAMRSKHVVSRDISGDAMKRAEGAEASLSENNDVITLGKETERREVEEENPSIPSLYDEVDPKQIDFGTTANMEDMRVSGKATPEMLASMSTPSDALLESENIFQTEGLLAAQPNKFSAKKSPSIDNNDNLITFNLETDEVFDKHLLNDAGDMGEKKYKKKKENVIISTKGLNQQLLSEEEEELDFSGDVESFGDFGKIPKIQAFSALTKEDADKKDQTVEDATTTNVTEKTTGKETDPTKSDDKTTTTIKHSSVDKDTSTLTPTTTTSEANGDVSKPSTPSNATSKETTSPKPANSSLPAVTTGCSDGNCSEDSSSENKTKLTNGTVGVTPKNATTATGQNTTSQAKQTATDGTTTTTTVSTSSANATTTQKAEAYVAKDVKLKDTREGDNNRIDVDPVEEEKITKSPKAKDFNNDINAEEGMLNVIDGVEPKDADKNVKAEKEADNAETSSAADATASESQPPATVKVSDDATTVKTSSNTQGANRTSTDIPSSATQNADNATQPQTETSTADEASNSTPSPSGDGNTTTQPTPSTTTDGNTSADHKDENVDNASAKKLNASAVDERVVATQMNSTKADRITQETVSKTFTTTHNETVTIAVSASTLVVSVGADVGAQTNTTSETSTTSDVDTTAKAQVEGSSSNSSITTVTVEATNTTGEHVPVAYLSDSKTLNAENKTQEGETSNTTTTTHAATTTSSVNSDSTPQEKLEAQNNTAVSGTSSNSTGTTTTTSTATQANTTLTVGQNNTTTVATKENNDSSTATAGTSTTSDTKTPTIKATTTEPDNSSADSSSTASSEESESSSTTDQTDGTSASSSQEEGGENGSSSSVENEDDAENQSDESVESAQTASNSSSSEDGDQPNTAGAQSVDSTASTSNDNSEEETQSSEETGDSVTEQSADSANTGTGSTGSKRSFVSLTDLITWYLKHWRNYSKWRKGQTTVPTTPAV